MTTLPRPAFFVCVTLWGIGCNSVPRISPYGQQPYEEIFSAPLVIVGVADSDIRVGAKRPAKAVFNDPSQLHRVRVRVENLLRGELSDPTIWVYYFGFD